MINLDCLNIRLISKVDESLNMTSTLRMYQLSYQYRNAMIGVKYYTVRLKQTHLWT